MFMKCELSMPMARAVAFMRSAKACSEPASAMPMAVAASLADRMGGGAQQVAQADSSGLPADPAREGGSPAARAVIRTSVSSENFAPLNRLERDVQRHHLG